MKKILTTAFLALGFFAANAQNESDISVRISSPTDMQAFDCEDNISISAYFTNNGPDNLDLTVDTNLRLGMQNSTDSVYMSGGQQLISFFASDSVVINNGDSLMFTSRTLKVKELFTVFDENGQNPSVFRENLPSGTRTIVVYANTSGVGTRNPTSNMFEEAANYIDGDSTNDMDAVRIVVTCPPTTSVKEINANTKQISVYPNPVVAGSAKFNYEFTANETATIRVMDVTGRTVMTQEVTGRIGVQTIELNVANLNSGLYNLEIATAAGRGVSKFTVK